MKALVMKEVNRLQVEECAVPGIQENGDAIVRVTTAGICGSDLHIVQGRDPGIRMNTIMGHEFVGTIEEVGTDVRNFRTGDRVLSPFSINCGNCFYCRRELPARCIHSFAFGFVNEEGKGLQGAQAEFVRVPFSSSTLVKIPDDLADEDVLFLGDIFSTAYSCAENASIREGDVVAIIGCGPVGLLSVIAAKLFHPAAIVAIDVVRYRLEKAESFGALAVSPENAMAQIRRLTEGRGADACLEAVGNPAALDLAIELSRPGAIISIAGYHTEAHYSLPINRAYGKNLTFKIGRCNARKYIDRLLPLVRQQNLPLRQIITHVLPLPDAVKGYDIFAGRKESAIKVLLKT